ncbi:hypothetical protein [Deinococcus hopiensis]|nr:hypothetical protein [Deinococcus hopiensis]
MKNPLEVFTTGGCVGADNAVIDPEVSGTAAFLGKDGAVRDFTLHR